MDACAPTGSRGGMACAGYGGMGRGRLAPEMQSRGPLKQNPTRLPGFAVATEGPVRLEAGMTDDEGASRSP